MMLAEPFFNRLRAEERAATGGAEWSIIAKREFLFQCTASSAHCAKAGSGSPVPTANTKQGKPHRAALKAGLWDEPPQLARALTAGF